MAEDAFVRMHRRLFARLGQEALLRGLPTTVILEHGIAVTGEYGQVTGFRSFAAFPTGDLPRIGDALSVDGKNYVVDGIENDDGHTTNCVLR